MFGVLKHIIADDEGCRIAPAAGPGDRPPMDPAAHIILTWQTQGAGAPDAHHARPRHRERAGPGLRGRLRRSVAADKGRGRDQGRHAGDAPAEAGVLRVCEAREKQGASVSGTKACWPRMNLPQNNPFGCFSTTRLILVLLNIKFKVSLFLNPLAVCWLFKINRYKKIVVFCITSVVSPRSTKICPVFLGHREQKTRCSNRLKARDGA